MLNSANRGSEKIIFGRDSIVIAKYGTGIAGGRTLDVAGFPLNNIFAGHAIVKLANGNYAPMPITVSTTTVYGATADATTTYATSEAAVAAGIASPVEITKNVTNEDGLEVYTYGTLPEGAAYAGVLYRTIAKADPQASIMIDGVVNEALLPGDFASIKSAFVAAVPNIIFVKAEEA